MKIFVSYKAWPFHQFKMGESSSVIEALRFYIRVMSVFHACMVSTVSYGRLPSISVFW